MNKNTNHINIPQISIVVPVYNTKDYVVRCLDSIYNQTFTDYEVLIVNDGSTDNSAELCSQYILDKPQFRLINKTNGGLTSARYCGWKEAVGKYIVFIDSDDFIESDYCKSLYDACESTQSGLAICSHQVVSDNQIISISQLPVSGQLITNIEEDYIKLLLSYHPKTKHRIPAFLWSRMMLREYITDDCFVDENKVFTEDLIFDLQYVRQVKQIAVVNRPLYNYYLSGGSLTRKYRPNLWQMYKNLYVECLNYCVNNKILNVSSQLSTLLIGGVLHCVQQAAKHFKYKEFKKDYKLIQRDKEFRKILCSYSLSSEEFKCLIINDKIVLLMVKYFPSWIVYQFYKWRQTR